MSAMMTLQQAHQWLPHACWVATHEGAATITFDRVHTDTRSLEPGDLFVALRGERFDAIDFLAEAKQRGAVVAIVQADDVNDAGAAAKLAAAGLPGLVVADAKAALGQLATQWRAQFKLPLIAVTGSNGKTTVTQMIASVLRAFKPENFHSTQGNLNNDIGVPLTLLRLRAHHAVAVIELGMNHPGEIAQLAAMAQPTVALVNNAQREHLEFMSTVEAVAQENGSVLQALGATGVAVFPCDDEFTPLWTHMAANRPVMRFCASDAAHMPDHAADVHCEQAHWRGDAWAVQVSTAAGSLNYALHIAGAHNVTNSLAAVACTLAVGVPLTVIARGLESFVPVKGRSRAFAVAHAGRAITVIDDTYNANPDSVHAAMNVLATLPAPRLMVLGDMGEVGTDGPLFHEQAGQYAQTLGIDVLFTLGTLAAKSTHSFTDQGAGLGRHFDDVQALQSAVLAELPRMGSVLVKGARFMKMERVLDVLTPLIKKE